MEPNRLASATGITAKKRKAPGLQLESWALPFAAHIPAYVRVSAEGMAPACRVAAPLTKARFIGLTPTLPEKIGIVVPPVTMRCPLRHRPRWDGGEDWEIPYWCRATKLKMD